MGKFKFNDMYGSGARVLGIKNKKRGPDIYEKIGSRLGFSTKAEKKAPMTEKGKVLEDFVYHFLKNKGYYVLRASEIYISGDTGADLFISKTQINPDLTSESPVAFITVSLTRIEEDDISRADQTSSKLNICNFLIIGPNNSFSRGSVIHSNLIWDLLFLNPNP